MKVGGSTKPGGNAATAVAILVLTSALAMPARAFAAGEGAHAGKQMALGVTTVVANVVYIPAKLVYAALGGVTGILAYGLTLGSAATATDIWVPSIGGDYVLTPAMVAGEEPFYFIGRSDSRD